MQYKDPIFCNKTQVRQALILNILPAHTIRYLLFLAPAGIMLMWVIPPVHAIIIVLCAFVTCWVSTGGSLKRRWQFNARKQGRIRLVRSYKNHVPLFEEFHAQED